MQIRIRIDCDNASFHPDPEDEVARILRDLADRLDHNRLKVRPPHPVSVVLFDANGNRVGELTATA